MKKPDPKEVNEFLYQSNLIEGVDNPVMLADAHTAWNYLMKQSVLTLGVILKTHKILMKNSGLYPNEVGYFRTVDVWVGGRKGAPPEEIPMLLQMQFVFETLRMHPPPDALALHIKYEEIHPFVDGNGRTGRMFWNWTRLKRCGEELGILYASEREEYYKLFQ